MTDLNTNERVGTDEAALDPFRLVSTLLDFDLPPACAPGVLVALKDLAEHFRRLRGPGDTLDRDV